MLNQVVLIGTVKEKPEIQMTPKGVNYAYILVETDRNFRNEDGTLSSDIFRVTLWRGIAEQCEALCRPGSLVAIRGRLKAETYEKNGKNYYNCEVIAEKVSFLSERIR